MESFWGADIRLLYGIGVPALVLLGLIVVFALHASWWLLAGLVVCLLLLTGVVMIGFLQMLGEDDDDDEDAGSVDV